MPNYEEQREKWKLGGEGGQGAKNLQECTAAQNYKKLPKHLTGGRDAPLAKCWGFLFFKHIHVETLNIVEHPTRCLQPLNSARLVSCHVQCLHNVCLKSTLCEGGGVPATCAPNAASGTQQSCLRSKSRSQLLFFNFERLDLSNRDPHQTKK